MGKATPSPIPKSRRSVRKTRYKSKEPQAKPSIGAQKVMSNSKYSTNAHTATHRKLLYPGQKPAAPDSSLADAQGADCNNDEGHAADLALLPALFEHIAKVRYPLGTGLGRRSIWKLGEFGERRAVRGLEWISGTALVPWRRLQVRRSRKSSKAIEGRVPSSRPQGQRDRACQACVTGWAWDNGEVEQNAAR